MRFRILHRGKGTHRSVPEKPAPAPENVPSPPRAADLDNPYGRVFGTPRSREDLRRP